MCPVLACFEKDLLVPADENKPHPEAALHKADNNDVTIKALPNANHRFEEPGFGAHDYGTSGKSVPGYYDMMVEWIKKRAPATSDRPRPNR